MRSLRDRESMQRGSPDYPLDYYLIDRNHPRYECPTIGMRRRNCCM